MGATLVEKAGKTPPWYCGYGEVASSSSWGDDEDWERRTCDQVWNARDSQSFWISKLRRGLRNGDDVRTGKTLGKLEVNVWGFRL